MGSKRKVVERAAQFLPSYLGDRLEARSSESSPMTY